MTPTKPVVSDRALATSEKVMTMSDYTSGTLTPLPADADAYDRAYAHIMAMTELQVAQAAEKLFKDNHYQQIIFVCWVKGVQNANRREVNPRSYPPNLIGEPGLGKSGLVYGLGDILSDWLSEIGGGPLEFQVVVRTLAGV